MKDRGDNRGRMAGLPSRAMKLRMFTAQPHDLWYCDALLGP